MLSIVKSVVLQGFLGVLINVEVDVSYGMPSWEIVGLPDVSVKESKERVRTAIKNSGIDFPSRRYVINLAPATIKKEGSVYDLSIAVGVLKSIGIINDIDFSKTVFVGELSLDGNVNKVNGVLPICIEALKNGIKKVIVPIENLQEALIVKELEIIGISNLKELIFYLNGNLKIVNSINKEKEEVKENLDNELDFSQVKGQENTKRALEIAAAGGHNCLMVGFPRLSVKL